VDESSREGTEYRIRKHVIPHLGNMSLASIKPTHIKELDAGLVANWR
jgi:Phage integrase, N-terminal SAM-like domain